MQRVGEKLRALRQKHGLTLRELATQLGMSHHSQLGNIEVSKRKPSAELALRIARFFGVSADQLIDDELELD